MIIPHEKEIIIAILLGLSLGLFITYIMYRSRGTSATSQNKILETKTQPSPSPESMSTLVIHSPQDESIVSDPNVTIAGNTEATNFVIIMVNDKESITTADATGAFSISAKFEAGSNIIQIHSIDEDGKATIDERVVVFTTKSFSDTSPAPTTEPTASPSAKPTKKP